MRNKSFEAKKIVFIKTGAIGDVLMTTPLVRAVRKAFPNASITYVVGEQSVAVLKNNPNIDHIITFDAYDALDKNIFKLLGLARTIQRQHFDLAFILDKSYLAGLFGVLCGIPIRIGFDRNGEGVFNTHSVPYAAVKHEIDYYLSLLHILHKKSDGNKMDLVIGEKEKRFAKEFFKKNNLTVNRCVCIAPAATQDPGGIPSTRCWPDESYAKLIKGLADKGIPVLLVGSPSDASKARHIEKLANVSIVSAVGKTKTMLHAAALMAQCPVTVTHDCGNMPVAAATGSIVIAIFGPTDPRRKAPPGSNPLWKGSSCTTCEIRGTFPYCDKHPKTTEIAPTVVLRAVERILKKKSSNLEF
ncbi:MAG: glycosyltransferase family 9 protein [Candidatus Aenigmarchaeota archaeon]|nr:glycosyltransferase family 9 protein [Candidatus Aenigmarchaeota archaeon]